MSTDYQTYPTRKAAKENISKMRGWDAKVDQIYLPDHPEATRSGNVWVIRTEGGYLRTDGYVR